METSRKDFYLRLEEEKKGEAMQRAEGMSPEQRRGRHRGWIIFQSQNHGQWLEVEENKTSSEKQD